MRHGSRSTHTFAVHPGALILTKTKGVAKDHLPGDLRLFATGGGRTAW